MSVNIQQGLTATGGGITFLGTITTTSGSSQSLSSLTLTSYSFLRCVLSGVSASAVPTNFQQNSITIGGIITSQSGATNGVLEIDLNNGVGWAVTGNQGSANTVVTTAGYPTGLTTASTAITFTTSANNFDAGSIRVYGVK